jgi:alkanesulfonate monooxygenase SsuD/methylene tetrahydromethanopterin reductase-like flavin-dependent oxidoreductase (luciferase family)
MGFATLASLAPGRILVGVGVSSPLVVERWHGRTFESPLPYVRRYLPDLRRALDGERLESGFRLGLDLEQRVPIVLAAMRPRMIELAGELADGVFLTWCPPDEAPARVALARRGAERAGRDPDDLLVLVSFFAYAGTDAEESLERMRRYLVQYACVPTHRESFRGTLAHLDEIGESWARGDRKRALKLVSDEEVQRITVVGTPADVVRRAGEFHTAGVDLPIVVATAAHVGDDAGPFATVEGVGALLAEAAG